MTKKNPLADPLRPDGGWLRARRQESGLSLQAVADRLDVSPQAIHQFEKSEAAGTISLRQLANVAAAMGCRLSYTVTGAHSNPAVLAPAKTEPAPAELPSPAAPAVELSLLLENQAAGRFD